MIDDDPISQLLRMYQHSLATVRTYQQLAGDLGLSGLPSPKIEAVRQQHQRQLEKEFRVYEQCLREGYSPEDALQKLIATFPIQS